MTEPSTSPHPERVRHWHARAWASRAPRALRPWLTDEGSLTRLLQRASNGQFSVRVLSQRYDRPSASEAIALGLPPRQRALVREVQLCGHGEPWVFARTLIPVTTLRGRQRTLKLIGSRPLGALLFSDPAMRRDPLQITALTTAAGQRLWARRSVFYLADKPLLVCEVFLTPPGVPDYPG